MNASCTNCCSIMRCSSLLLPFSSSFRRARRRHLHQSSTIHSIRYSPFHALRERLAGRPFAELVEFLLQCEMLRFLVELLTVGGMTAVTEMMGAFRSAARGTGDDGCGVNRVNKDSMDWSGKWTESGQSKRIPSGGVRWGCAGLTLVFLESFVGRSHTFLGMRGLRFRDGEDPAFEE